MDGLMSDRSDRKGRPGRLRFGVVGAPDLGWGAGYERRLRRKEVSENFSPVCPCGVGQMPWNTH